MKIFGFEIKRSKKARKDDDFIRSREKGANTVIVSAGDRSINQMAFMANLQEDREKIERYRLLARSDYVTDAISDIKNEAVVRDEISGEIVNIDLSKTNFTTSIKNSITEEFDYIKSLLNFGKQAPRLFEEWLIDGRHFFYLVSKSKKTEGLKEIRKLDSRCVQRTRKIEFDPNRSFEDNMRSPTEEISYQFLPPEIEGHDMSWMSGLNEDNVVELTNDSIAYSDSGLYDEEGSTLSVLDKAIKPFNQLDMMEDHLVIYRVTRSIEKIIYRIGVGSLSPTRVEEQMRKIIDKFRSEEIYDSSTGNMRGQYQSRAMREDIFLPTRGNSMDTQIDQLRGADNLGQIEDVIYFRKRLYKALRVPLSRLESEGGFQMARSTEITRDEIKFSLYVKELVDQFSIIFYMILKRHLILKKIITEDEWRENEEKIIFNFTSESMFRELKRLDVLQERFNLMRDANEAREKQFLSKNWIKKNILNFTDEEIKAIDKEIENEPDEPEDNTQPRRF